MKDAEARASIEQLREEIFAKIDERLDQMEADFSDKVSATLGRIEGNLNDSLGSMNGKISKINGDVSAALKSIGNLARSIEGQRETLRTVGELIVDAAAPQNA